MKETLARRAALAEAVDARLGPFAPDLLRSLLEVPRERFVRPGDLASAYEDHPLPLDDVGLATISAPHAYLLSFRLAELSEGDSLLELGSGSGYGAALAASIVGTRGRVRTVEIDPVLAARARDLLAIYPNVQTLRADASKTELSGFAKVIVTYAVRHVPDLWLATLSRGPGAALILPLGPPGGNQRLTRITRDASTRSGFAATDHGAVRYVPDRSPTLTRTLP